MLLNIFKLLLALLLFVAGLAFVYFIAFIAGESVMPALQAGTLNLETTSRILNINWVGNEVYIILAIYAAIAAGFFTSGIMLARRVIKGMKAGH